MPLHNNNFKSNNIIVNDDTKHVRQCFAYSKRLYNILIGTYKNMIFLQLF